MVKNNYLLSRYLIFLLFISSCTILKSQNLEKIDKISDSVKITNFIQLYHGYETRLPWHNNEIKHYIYKDNNGIPEWLFDGFLFLEIYADFGDKRYDYGALMPGKLAPGKEVWENLICKTFEDSRGPNALESVLDSLASKGHTPPYTRTVVFTLPNPIFGTIDWGFVEGKALDFAKIEDRFTAAKWYISRILDEWKKREYKHINFGGFYWQHEGIDFKNDDHLLVQIISVH